MNNDIQQIKNNGGVTAVAKKIGCSPQRVQNWICRRKVPAQIKLDHPEIFPYQKVSSTVSPSASEEETTEDEGVL